MKKFRHYLAASIGLILFVSVIAFSLPQTGHSSMPTLDKDVIIVNTPAQAVPVAVQGIPAVEVENSAANPVLVRDVDRPVQQPFQVQVDLTLGDGFGGQNALIPVPAGKLLVIENITAYGNVPQDQIIDSFAVLTHLAPDLTNRSHFLNFEKRQFSGFDTYTVSQMVRIYADTPGASVRATRLTPTGSVTFKYTVSGYLLDK